MFGIFYIFKNSTIVPKKWNVIESSTFIGMLLAGTILPKVFQFFFSLI